MTTPERSGLSRWTLFLALSRTPHGVVDLATPALGALLALGRLPTVRVGTLGFCTAFAGYTAVYALNDVIDWKADRKRLATLAAASAGDLDAVFPRHPLARGDLTYREGLLWVCAWALAALAGAWALRPACALVFVGACALEALYCRLFQVHPLRTLASGVVKSAGLVAAVLAVSPTPSLALLGALFAWIFFWEIGGQNVPNDWTDREEDARVNARTIPVVLGDAGASAVVVSCLAASLAAGWLALASSPAALGLPVQGGALALGLWLLAAPAWRLVRSPGRDTAAALFNRATWYPAAVLALVGGRLLW